MKIPLRWKRAACLFGRHEPERSEFRETGFATLGYDGWATREYGYLHTCRCGHSWSEDGKVIFGDAKLNPERYGSDRWPLTEAGERMPIRSAR